MTNQFLCSACGKVSADNGGELCDEYEPCGTNDDCSTTDGDGKALVCTNSVCLSM